MAKTARGKTDIAGDLEFAASVMAGEEKLCERFVEEFTDWVLYKIRDLMKSHCPYPASEYSCCLVHLWHERKGTSESSVLIQCDECIDSYIWMFEYLKKRLAGYKGKNNSTLKTYIWSILNSSYMFNDWLRWKYGRAY